MEREQFDRLLAEYATGGLSEEERKELFAAALADQELFDQLMEEDALREAIELPGARNRLIDSLQEEEAEVAMMFRSAPAAPAPVAMRSEAAKAQMRPPASRPPAWLAWAAGIGVVFVSGSITYMLFDRPELAKLAQVTSSAPKDTKPFVPPPSATAPAPAKRVVVEEPPKIVAENRAPLPQPVMIPLPSTPPPPMPKAADAVADKPAVARNEVVAEFRAQTQQPAAAPPPSQQAGPAAPALARRQAAPGGGMAVGGIAASSSMQDMAKEKDAAPVSAWRRTGDGVWIRVPAGEAVGRTETVAIRYVPRTATRISLVTDRGQRLTQRDGRVGEELELPVPASAMATGDALALRIVEEPRAMKVSGRADRTEAPQVRIILRLR